MKKCRHCKELYEPRNSLQRACSMLCALGLVETDKARQQAEQAREERKAHRERREKLKTRGEHAKEAQAAFNAWVRERDHDRPCISCGRYHSGKYDAGHYRSVGSNPALRFEEANCHKQCVPCNQHKSGNAIEYRIGLVARIGADKVAWLEGPHPAKQYTIEELQGIKRHYRAEVRRLQKEREACAA